MNAAEPELRKLVDLELEAANRENPPFHSPHEGYAVILEEVEEAGTELASVKQDLKIIWGLICRNEAGRMMTWARYLEKTAVHLAAEAIQVAAMAKKFQQLEGRSPNETLHRQ